MAEFLDTISHYLSLALFPLCFLIFHTWRYLLRLAFILVTILYFFWGLALDFNDYLAEKFPEKQPNQRKKAVVIVGGGFAGAYMAMKLEARSEFDVTLIDTKEYFEFTPSVLRTVVEPFHIRYIQRRHSDYLRRTRIIRNRVIHATPNCVITDSGEWVTFDYLVLASGSKYNEPFKGGCNTISVRESNLHNYYERLCNARRVLIIGGGTVGVELAAEIAEHHPNKEIILVHSREHLLSNENCLRATAYVEKYLKSRGIRLVLNTRVTGYDADRGMFLCERTGNVSGPMAAERVEIAADMGFMCTGIMANSSYLEDAFADRLERGFVVVDRHLRMVGFPNIFAAGDVAYNCGDKLCQTAQREAAVVVANIISSEKHHKTKHLKEYAPSTRPMLVSLGKYNGVFIYNQFAFGGIVPACMKEFVEWKEMVRYYGFTGIGRRRFESARNNSIYIAAHAHLV